MTHEIVVEPRDEFSGAWHSRCKPCDRTAVGNSMHDAYKALRNLHEEEGEGRHDDE